VGKCYVGWVGGLFVDIFVEFCLCWLSQDLGQDLVQKCSENGVI
jgi:hypothetical protein